MGAWAGLQKGIFHPGCSRLVISSPLKQEGGWTPLCSALGQPQLLFLLSRVCSFLDCFLSSASQAPRLPDRRDENELSSSVEEKIRERHGGKVREIKQK